MHRDAELLGASLQSKGLPRPQVPDCEYVLAPQRCSDGLNALQLGAIAFSNRHYQDGWTWPAGANLLRAEIEAGAYQGG